MTPGKKTVLVTGASSGIGEALAERYAAGGDRLILTARREDRLNLLAQRLRDAHGTDVEVVVCDLAAAGGAAALQREVEARVREVDVLVNNAGFGALGRFAELDPERQAAMVRLNVGALTDLCRWVLPGMVARGRGGVLNVASMAAFQAGPNMAVYYASKAYVVSFSEAIAEELRGTGVTVTVLCPGPTATEFGEAADMADAKLFHLGTMTAERVAGVGWRAAEAGRLVVVPGAMNRVGTWLAKWLPRRVTRRIVARLQQPGGSDGGMDRGAEG
ncbi:MAG: SDR family oxidoreductase [Planctomycetota bacterium]